MQLLRSTDTKSLFGPVKRCNYAKNRKDDFSKCSKESKDQSGRLPSPDSRGRLGPTLINKVEIKTTLSGRQTQQI